MDQPNLLDPEVYASGPEEMYRRLRDQDPCYWDATNGIWGLSRYRDAFVSELSTGTRRIVELACAMAHLPSVLLLDEPSSGIAQRETEALGQVLLDLKERTGAALVVIEPRVVPA